MPASGHFSGDSAAAEGGDEDLLNQLSQELGLQQFANDASSYQVGKMAPGCRLYHKQGCKRPLRAKL